MAVRVHKTRRTCPMALGWTCAGPCDVATLRRRARRLPCPLERVRCAVAFSRRGVPMKLPTQIVPFALLVSVCLAWVGCSSQTGTDATPSPVVPTVPSQLTPPPSGQGVQLMTDAFTVSAGEELQVCYFFKVSDLLA